MSERDTIPATCPRCGRPRGMESAELCYEPGAGTCVIAAAAYRRGIDEGVRLAKARAKVAGARNANIVALWHEVDEAAAAAKGGDHG